MNKFVGAAGIASALLVGAAFGPVVAGAQTGPVADGSGPVAAELESPECSPGLGRPGSRANRRPRATERDAIVSYLLGLSTEEIRSALQSGATLAEVADGQGVSTDELVATLVDAAHDRLDSGVADGRLGQEKADMIAERLSERITSRVNGEHVGGPGVEGPRRDQSSRVDS